MNPVFKDAIKSLPRKRQSESIDDWLLDGELLRCERERLLNGNNGDQPGRVICQCAEGIINGKRIPIHRPEDCRYSEARSELVPMAVALTNSEIALTIANGGLWTKIFNRQMDRLSAPLLGNSNKAV